MSKKNEYGLMEKIAAAAFSAIIIGLNIYLFNAKPCTGIDQIYLSCKYTGTFGDWLGTIMIDGAAGWFMYRFFYPSWAGSEKSNPARYAFWVIALGLGIISIW
jgi:hypothetical protein